MSSGIAEIVTGPITIQQNLDSPELPHVVRALVLHGSLPLLFIETVPYGREEFNAALPLNPISKFAEQSQFRFGLLCLTWGRRSVFVVCQRTCTPEFDATLKRKTKPILPQAQETKTHPPAMTIYFRKRTQFPWRRPSTCDFPRDRNPGPR